MKKQTNKQTYKQTCNPTRKKKKKKKKKEISTAGNRTCEVSIAKHTHYHYATTLREEIGSQIILLFNRGRHKTT